MKQLKHTLLVCCLLGVGWTSKAQTLYTYANAEDGTAGGMATGVTVSALTPVNGVVSINACGTGFSTDTWSTSTGAFSTAFSAVQFTITPSAGYEVTVTSMQFDLGRNPQGPQRMRYAYSTDGGTTWTNNGSDYSIPSGSCGAGTTFSWDLADFTTTSAVIFRIYGWNASNVNGHGRMYNGSVGGSACAMQTWYADTDGDGFGDAGATTIACNAPVGFVADNTDCDDDNGSVYPGATEVCDGVDNDCDGDIDEVVVTAVMSPTGAVFTCKSDPFTWSVEPCAGCTYQWFKNDNAIAGATGTSYSTTKPAYYNVQVTIPGGCFDMSDYSLLTTELNPNANIYHPNGLNLCAPSPGTNIIVKVGYTATNTYQWYKDGAPYTGTGADSWRIFPSEAGDYYCSITSASGCNRITETKTVINSCRLKGMAGTDNISVYPNPAAAYFQLAMSVDPEITSANLIITDLTGKMVAQQMIACENGAVDSTIPVADLPSGMYLIVVEAGGVAYNTNLIIE